MDSHGHRCRGHEKIECRLLPSKHQQLHEQGRNVAAYNAPQSIIIDTKVAVDKPIASGDDEPPRYLCVGLTNRVWNMACRYSKLRTVAS